MSFPGALGVCNELQHVPASDCGWRANQVQSPFGDVISLPREASLLEQKSMSGEQVVIRAYWSWKEVVFLFVCLFVFLFLFFIQDFFFPLRTESYPKAQ